MRTNNLNIKMNLTLNLTLNLVNNTLCIIRPSEGSNIFREFFH
jgi:hypothetical protein